ncbi:MAG: hypothetical protein ACE5FU_04860, partial [Nitrospinota bacterium]
MIFKKYLTFFLLLGIPFVFDRRPCYSVELSYSDLAVTYALNKEKFIPLKRNSTIELFSARNEAVFFQVALTSFERSGILKIQKKGLSGEGKRTRVNVYTVERCQTQFDSDCLIPVTGLGELQASRGELSVFFIELKVPEGVPQGEYRGAIQFFLGQSNVAVVNYKLKVHPFTLPKQPSLKVDLNNYGAGFVSEAGYSPGSEDAAFMIQKYYRFVSEHGMVFNPLPYKSQRGNPHPGMAPILEGEGENIKVKDWTAYNRLYGPIFDGTLFASKIPIEHQFVPFNPEWPSDFKNFFSDRKRYETEWERIAKEFLLNFKKMGWYQTTFQVYLNQNPKPNNKIPWNLDEP